MDSSWYFLRYTNTLNDDQPFAKHIATTGYRLTSIAVALNTLRCLIYARFMTKALRDMD